MLLFRTLLLTNDGIVFHRKVILKTISQLKLKSTNEKKKKHGSKVPNMDRWLT